MQIRLRNPLTFAFAFVVALGCRQETTAPVEFPGDIAVRTERAEYHPVDLVIVTTTNLNGATVYDDHCDGAVQGYELLKRWSASYGSRRLCDTDGSNWISHSVAIPSGATHVDTMYVNVEAYTGTWRVMLFLREKSGAVLPEAKRLSNAFRVNGTWAP